MKTQLKKNEKVVLTIKRHWFSLTYPIIVAILIILLGYIVIKFYSFLVAILFVIYKIIDRKTNLWIVTNLRVIDEFGVFSVNTKETPLDKINNVSYRKPFLGRIFGFGNVVIQSAAESGTTTHILVEKPKLLKDTITEYQEKYKENTLKIQNQPSNSNINNEIEKLHGLKEKGIITELEFKQGKNKILNN